MQDSIPIANPMLSQMQRGPVLATLPFPERHGR